MIVLARTYFEISSKKWPNCEIFGWWVPAVSCPVLVRWLSRSGEVVVDSHLIYVNWWACNLLKWAVILHLLCKVMASTHLFCSLSFLPLLVILCLLLDTVSPSLFLYICHLLAGTFCVRHATLYLPLFPYIFVTKRALSMCLLHSLVGKVK